ncbi:metal ABC transporter ATP-binding protein [Roseibium sp. RKSG952]|uniref:metal ABC transporter ATP-binding protein n=1 Tax=Roseibium sp. RKSG952 TaxID=2529384 RepID=UPI0018AD224A|nr:ATP-binding cassette domain-containing protein [Roseibium sp. RKSG952]
MALEFDKVCLRYGRHVTLEAGTFSVEHGKFIGMLGANGAGKTTLLKAVLGLQRTAAGSISVFGRPTRRGNPKIGYVAQSHRQIDDLGLSGHDLLLGSLTGRRYGRPFSSKADRRDVARVQEITGVTELARLPVRKLSGGERKRILIAQALLGSPQMLLLDEPLVSLDPNHQEGVVRLVRAIQTDLGITVLFCSHELTPLLGKVDGIMFLGQRKVALGSVDEVITPKVMTDLYDAPMKVVRSEGRIFVVDDAPSQVM